MRTRILVTVGLLLGVAPPLFATPFVPPPACVANTLDEYLLLDPAGCSVGDEVAFSGFSFAVVSAGGGAIPIAASDIVVTPTAAGLASSLTFASTGFSVTGTEFATYQVGYTIDPHPILSGFDDVLDASSPVFPGLVSITTDLCIGAGFTGTSCVFPGVPDAVQVFHNGIAAQLVDSTTFMPVALLGVLNTIDLQANGASADFSSVTNTVNIVPEPATWLLIGSGLLGSRLLRRGTRARRSFGQR
jgi:PEP-CTERM motif